MGERATDEDLAVSGSPLQGRTGYRLIKLGELLMSRAEAALAPLGVRPRHLNVLAALAADESLSQQDVSRLLGIDPNVMVGVIDDLEELRLAQRQRNPKDRRRHVVVLTSTGKRVLRDGTKLLDEAEDQIFGVVSTQSRAVLHEAAGQLLTTHGPVHKH